MLPSEFAVFSNAGKDPDFEKAQRIASFLQTRGAKVHLLKESHRSDLRTVPGKNVYSLVSDLPKVDMAVILGGDGTMLSSARRFRPAQIPLLGINFGHLGFLTSGDENEAETILDEVLAGSFFLENRMMLQGRVIRKGEVCAEFFALNDAVVHRSAYARMLGLELRVNRVPIDHLEADGLIVSTPTGSTGYNLSAYGPMVAPYSRALVVTPICAASLFVRSLVCSGDDHVSFEVCSDQEADESRPWLLSIDGQEEILLESGDLVEIEASAVGIDLVRLNGSSFFETMRHKLFTR